MDTRDFMLNYYETIKNLYGIYIIWILLYYISSHLHVYLCTPNTYIGFILMPFVAPAPHCQALRWVIYNGGNSIVNMWLLLGSWLLVYIKPIK